MQIVRALFATALAQVSVPVIALIAGFGSTRPIWPLDILVATGFIAALWLLSAWLFRKAAQAQSFASIQSAQNDFSV